MKPSDFSLIQTFLSLGKPYYTISDFEKILLQKRQSLYVALTRLNKTGVLRRLQNNVYVFALQKIDIEKIANQLYYPSYLSFETALSRYGIVSQIPYTLTMAAPMRSKKMQLGDVSVEFRQIKKELFFGYNLVNGVFIAEPEKALVDQLYMTAIGRGTLETDELNLKNISFSKLKKIAAKFPEKVQSLARDLLRRKG